MRFVETPIAGVFVVELEPHADDRGFFARAFCRREFATHGLEPDVVQANLSGNHQAGTTRGLHFQDPTHPESKFFRCIRGATFNVAVDARRESPTFGRWFGIELTDENHVGLYIPPVCAAGYQALVDGAEVLYTVSSEYAPQAERGLRLDDPAIGIDWPLVPSVVSDKDRQWPLLET